MITIRNKELTIKINIKDHMKIINIIFLLILSRLVISCEAALRLEHVLTTLIVSSSLPRWYLKSNLLKVTIGKPHFIEKPSKSVATF